MFKDKALADKATIAVGKQIHYDGANVPVGELGIEVGHIEETMPTKMA